MKEEVAGREVVVLLHPLALSGEIWQLWRGHLSADWRVETPDLPGHGASRWNGRPWTVSDAADEVQNDLSARGVDRAHLVGASLGGCVALALACRHPRWVASLSLLDTTASYGETAPTDWAERAERALGPRDKQLEWQLDRWFTPEFAKAGGPIVELVSLLFVQTTGPAHAAACRALGGFDAREQARAITIPTLVLTGEMDGATPVEMGRDLSERIAGATFRTVPGTRHFSFLEAPGPLHDVVAHLRVAGWGNKRHEPGSGGGIDA